MSRGLPHTGLPLVIKDANGNLTQRTSAGDGLYAALRSVYLAGIQTVADYPSKSDRYCGSVVNNSTTSTEVGSFTDTIHDSPVNDPVTTITSTTTTLYQLDDTISAPSPHILSADSDGQIYEMNDEEMILAAGALYGFALSAGTLPGFTFRIATSTPSPTSDWEVWESAIFTDTLQSGSDTVYNLYRRKLVTPASNAEFSGLYDATYGITVCYKTINSKPAIQQATDLEVARSYAYACQLQRASTGAYAGVGKYLLLASGDTLPSGTWVSRGSAIDTRRQTIDMQFGGQREIGQPFVGFRDVLFDFVGHRDTDQNGPGEDFANAQGQKFAGQRQYIATRQVEGDFTGSRDGQFTGVGVRPVSSTSTIETYTLYVKTAI